MPGRPGASRPTSKPSARPGRRAGGTRPRPPVPQVLTRPKLTGRAAILVLVVSVLMVSYASSFRAYLQQREHMSRLNEQIARAKADIAELEREKQRWHDPAYIELAARRAFGFVMPGETGFTVIGEDGRPLRQVDELSEPRVRTEDESAEWYQAAWRSVLLAGDPPAPADEPEPATRITLSGQDDGNPQEQDEKSKQNANGD